MTESFVRDDVLDAVLRSRAGDGAPTDLYRAILAAVAADGPRATTRRGRAAGHPWRLLAVAAVLLVGLGTAVFLAGTSRISVVTPSPEPQPTQLAVAPSATAGPALTEAFASVRAGYTVHYPAGWQATGATQPWKKGTTSPWSDPAFDVIRNGDTRFAAASQPLVQDQVDSAWYRIMCRASGGTDCTAVPGSWIPVTIGGSPGYIDVDGETAAGGGSRFDALAVRDRRGYEFAMVGRADRGMFDALLSSISMSPDLAADLPVLTGTFTSPKGGYTIGLADGWTTKPGANASDDDEVHVTGTDTSVLVHSEPLPAGQTFDEFLTDAYRGAFGAVPNGCEGGDPSTWKTVAVGKEQGRLQMLCNAATLHVLVGGRLYHFAWANANFVDSDHLSLPSWEALLQSVTFDPASAR